MTFESQTTGGSVSLPLYRKWPTLTCAQIGRLALQCDLARGGIGRERETNHGCLNKVCYNPFHAPYGADSHKAIDSHPWVSSQAQRSPKRAP
jgi:hypothetical protein